MSDEIIAPYQTRELHYRPRTIEYRSGGGLIEDLVNPFDKREFLVAWERLVK